MSRTNEKLLQKTCLCVCVCTCVCIRASQPTLQVPQFPVSASVQAGDDMTVAFFVYLLQGRALHVSLCCCHKRSKHWRRDGNTVITAKMRLFVKTARALRALQARASPDSCSFLLSCFYSRDSKLPFFISFESVMNRADKEWQLKRFLL